MAGGGLVLSVNISARWLSITMSDKGDAGMNAGIDDPRRQMLVLGVTDVGMTAGTAHTSDLNSGEVGGVTIVTQVGGSWCSSQCALAAACGSRFVREVQF